MANVIRSISYADEDRPVIEEAEKIAKREKRSFSKLVVIALQEYDKTHGAGNPSYSLDHFDKPEAVVFPSPYKPIGFSDLASYSWKEDDEMIAWLSKATVILKLDRQTKRDAEIKAKGLTTRI